ncbi:o-succinylbenzoate synthase [Lentibacillus sp. JNUCC-1]|uniref:o-succinylbenzoate synthase n=1 Tax=Lentibacillus sp. JNUCC-1 TaxID=2654513 RepID=UPI0012E702F2|nr:o-succinylbenzoate synthase [Lentibacillus sp. JNUCC-1]MUV38880.1 o-succinylbenzoate synthase [Lentibacillus sp. JNUCC-1]
MPIDIARIQLRRMRMRLKHPFGTSFGTLQNKEFFIIEAIDSAGETGYGESVAFSAPWYTEETVETNLHIMRDFLIPLLKNNPVNHPDELSRLFAPIRRNNMAKAALEGAVWDLYAKQQNVSLAAALGGTRSRVEVGVSIGIQPTINELLEKIAAYVEEGYKRIKLKIKPGQDIDMLKAVRNAFPDIALMADANSAYTLEDIQHLKQLDALQLLMIEQPLAHNDIIDHAKLQQSITTPICLDESIHALSDVEKAHRLGSCQIINVKSGRVGGLTAARRIHDYCLENNMPVWCGGMLESGIGRAHNIALASLPQFILPGDISGSDRYWDKDIIDPEIVVQDGYVAVPDKPGIGVTVDQQALEAFTKSIKSYHL